MDFPRFIVLRKTLHPDACDSQVNERLMRPRAIFHQGLGRRSCAGNYVSSEVPRMLRETRDVTCAIPAGSAHKSTLCVPRCLKSFPISVLHTITPTSTALHRYAVPLLANTSIRRAREWFNSWPGLPRFFAREKEREIHTAFLKGGS